MQTFVMNQNDIARGQRKSCWRCPVARCLERHGYKGAAVDEREIDVEDEVVCTPAEVAAFIEAYDAGQPVEPITFTLNID